MNKEETRALFIEWGNEKTAVTVLGKTVYVRELSTAEMDRRLAANKQEWQANIPITTGATAVICDENGELVFDPGLETDVQIVGKVPWMRIQQLVSAIRDEKEENPQGN